jgi:hypothetical protein
MTGGVQQRRRTAGTRRLVIGAVVLVSLLISAGQGVAASTNAAPAVRSGSRFGCEWRITGPLAGHGALLYAVSAISPSDAWAVGQQQTDRFTIVPHAYHWDGVAWRSVSMEDQAGEQGILDDVTAVGPDDVWATGLRIDRGTGSSCTLAEHWNGTSWTIVPTPNPDEQGNELRSVTAVPGTDELWAAASRRNRR